MRDGSYAPAGIQTPADGFRIPVRARGRSSPPHGQGTPTSVYVPVTVTGPQAKPPQKRERMVERFCSIGALLDAMAVAFRLWVVE